MPSLFYLLEQSRSRDAKDGAACEGALWCLAALAHLVGGRALLLARYPSHETSLFDAVRGKRPFGPNCVALALSALRSAAADPLSVRRIARQLKRVQARRDRALHRLSLSSLMTAGTSPRLRSHLGEVD